VGREQDVHVCQGDPSVQRANPTFFFFPPLEKKPCRRTGRLFVCCWPALHLNHNCQPFFFFRTALGDTRQHACPSSCTMGHVQVTVGGEGGQVVRAPLHARWHIHSEGRFVVFVFRSCSHLLHIAYDFSCPPCPLLATIHCLTNPYHPVHAERAIFI